MIRAALPLLLATLAAFPANADDDSRRWYDGLRQGEFKFALRYRFEHVEDDELALDADASTIRSRLTYRSAAWHRWSAIIEGDAVHAIGGMSYNDTRNARQDRPTVADPEGVGLNQALLQYAGTRYGLSVGRQRLGFDDHRFIGGVAWRQNEQTFDAVTARARWTGLDLSYSYVANVSRIFGPDAGTPPANLRGDTHLINARTNVGPLGSLVAFAYQLEFDRAPALSSRTIGLRSQGNHSLMGRTRWIHTASFAQQDDAGRNPVDARTQYTLFELGLKRDLWTLLAGREVLSGNATRGDRSFQTPLATLHLFQGWADKFGTTPLQGIDDRYVSLAGAWRATKLQLAWHDFDAAAVARDYGRELDVSFAWQISRQYELLLKAADYRSHGLAADTRKLWLQVNAVF